MKVCYTVGVIVVELYKHSIANIQGVYATLGESYQGSFNFWNDGKPVKKGFEKISWFMNEIFQNSKKPVPLGLSFAKNDLARADEKYYRYYFGKDTITKK